MKEKIPKKDIVLAISLFLLSLVQILQIPSDKLLISYIYGIVAIALLLEGLWVIFTKENSHETIVFDCIIPSIISVVKDSLLSS